ncbi:MAG: hypothetical protein HXY41_17385 [Chloroflexi bacterium]|nr:hypothetical protein [Chloroflexota bacterium]
MKAAAPFQPEIIPAVGRDGYHPGTLIAPVLRTEIHPVRLLRRVNACTPETGKYIPAR